MERKWMVLLATLLLVLVLSGCAAQPSEEADAVKTPVTISVAFWNGAKELTGDAFQTYVEEKFGIRFEPLNISYDNYSQWLQQLAADDALPDIIANDILGTSAYESWITQGKIRAVPKDLTAYPHLQAYLDQPYIERFKRDTGAFYAVPRLTYSEESLWALDRCIMVRKDWMEKLNLSEPRSFEEFRAMLSAFVTQDPDGNGVDDTGGLTATHLNTLEAVYLSLFPELSNTERGWLYEDGQWMPVYCSKHTGQALAQMQGLYRDGLLDSQFAYVSIQEAAKSFAEGRVGAICGQYYTIVNAMAQMDMLDEVSDLVQILPTFPAADGQRYRFTTSLHWSESYFGAGADDEKMNLILSLYDWLLSDEFQLLNQYGLEGVDWQRNETGEIVRRREISPMREYPSMTTLNHLVEWHQDEQYELNDYNILTYGEENLQYARERLAWFEENAHRVNYNFDVVFMSTPAKNSLVYNSVVQEEMVKVIVGSEDAESAWAKALQNLRQTTTLDDAISEVTREAALLGIEP